MDDPIEIALRRKRAALKDEIAQMLGVSRPTAQRFVSQCRSEGLITFRMNHPIADCMVRPSPTQSRHSTYWHPLDDGTHSRKVYEDFTV